MAITSLDMSFEKASSQTTNSDHSSKRSCRLLQLPSSDFKPENTMSNATSKCITSKKKKQRSPYLAGDRVQLLSRVIEKRFVRKTNFVSSFPLALNLYKTNSDDFHSSKKTPKKIKKSVLTLPNDPAPVPQGYTVSDMNDSEYCKKEDEDRTRKVVKKRLPIQNKRKGRVRERDFEFYDRDAQYCSQLNINLDCSSTDMMKSFNGDGKRPSNRKKIIPTSKKPQTASNNLSDVWAVLRNINSFQFRPSPPMSDESIVPEKKKLQKKSKKANRKDRRMIETSRTEEFAYISSYELDKSAVSFSPSCSIDRITVIDKQDEFSKICDEFEKRLLGTHDYPKGSNNAKNLLQRNKILCKGPKSNVKALGNAISKDNKPFVPLKRKKKMNLKRLVPEQSNSKITEKDSLITTDNLLLDDNSNMLSNKTAKDITYLAKASVGSDFSGSSKTELPKKINERVSRNDKLAFLNKEHESTANIERFDHQQRKPRLITTMPTSCTIAKLTQTEIKRRLTNMRFPIVVLGKDQVSSSIEVKDYDPPQFNGLDDHIWPFMVEWSPNTPTDTKPQNNMLSGKCLSYLDINSEGQIKSKSCKVNTEESTYKHVALKDKKQATDDSTKRKARFVTTPTTEIKDKLLECTKKQKSIVQLKDKMLNFLYKRSSNRDNYETDKSKLMTLNNNVAMAENDVTAITNKQFRQDDVFALLPLKRVLSTEGRNKKSPLYKHPWAKAKWASDFIDNVMKKIRKGVYYTQDRKDFCHTYQIDLKEVSVQAGSLCDSTDSTQTCDSEVDFTDDGLNKENQNNFISIPGFNNTLPLLEIKTLNMNQITVKHCVTNVMVEFDVTVPTKKKSTTNLNTSSLLLTPIGKTEGQSKVFKCKTTIFNAMLPAELCSILPKMMNSITDSSKNSIGSPTLSASNQSRLSTISELTRNENGDQSSNINIAPIQTSPEVEHILEGRFSNNIKKLNNKNNFKIKYDHCLVTELLPKVLLNKLLNYKLSPLAAELDNSQYTHSQISLQQSNKKFTGVTDIQNNNICTSVKIYTDSNKRLITAFNTESLVGIVKSMMCRHKLQLNHNLSSNYLNYNLSSYVNMLKQYDGKNLQINMSMINNSGVQKTVSVTVSNLNVDSLYKSFPKIKESSTYQLDTKNAPLKCIEYNNTSLARKSKKTEQTKVSLKKIKKNSFFKLYRRCKSANRESGEKCLSTASTPLDKITTLDDFFQILGSKTVFSSVFDGNVAKKILSSVTEMKNWISEINPKQALLILLLNNKKDTQNLVRFRPIILQGIAVNRITRASELDMEIEVIDRENFNKFPQEYEGITYLPESVTNYENLLDELYWIAKTTASDYNKPFDESSERLLKSLLQKRKKLNPSYLRVMARYVGLGLVKTQTEC